MRRNRLIVAFAAGLVISLVASACGSGGGGLTEKKDVLQVASCLDFPPFEEVKKGAVTGFDIDLTDAIAKKLGLKVQWVQQLFDTIFTGVAGGQFDMVAAAVTATGKLGKERSQTVAFSDFYFNSLQSLAVNTQETPDVKTTDDLKSGDAVGVQRGTTGEDWAKINLQPKGISVRSYDTAPDAFRDLEAGTIQGVVNDDPSSREIVKDLTNVSVVESIDTNEKYAFAFSQDNTELRDKVNTALQELINDGTWAKIFKKYFPEGAIPAEYQAK
jgi:polar amino acid transport system substrate-binding protein